MPVIKIFILKDDPTIYLIGYVTELDEEPSYLLESCFSIAPDGTLSEYPLHVNTRDIFLTSTDILSILDPSITVLAEFHRTTKNIND